MRLICPNCDAQYEVPDEVVPVTGRDVQCSNCGNTWFQHHPDHLPEPEDEEIEEELSAVEPEDDEELAPEPPLGAPKPRRRQLDPAVAEILRQEAEVEHEARRRRQRDQSLESQPDLGLEAPASGSKEPNLTGPSLERRAPVQKDEEISPEAAAAAAAIASRRELLPDIDELNSSLREESSTRSVPPAVREEVGAGGEPKQPGGFRRGFLTVLIIFALLALTYIYAPELSDLVPPASGLLSDYVQWVDRMRVALDGQLRSAVDSLNNMASASSGQ